MSSVRARWFVFTALLFLLLSPSGPCPASDTPAPTNVTLAGSLQDEAGCPGDWDPSCLVTQLTFEAADRVWQGTFNLPAGSFEYKAALNLSWTEDYGANAQLGGSNLGLTLAAPGSVKFYYDHETHWITDNVGTAIATVAGNFQSELGCPGDWQPDCLLSWLQDPDGDEVFTFVAVLPAGSYEANVAHGESWTESYGAGGALNGPNIPFTVAESNLPLRFTYVLATHVLTIAPDRVLAVSEVPALGGAGLALLSALLVLIGVARLRRS